MLRTVTAALLCVFFMFGCGRAISDANARRALTGRWLLNTNRNCTYGAVESDELILYEDGKMEQHLRLKDGRKFDSNSEHWSFIPKTNIGLESRWNFPAGAKAPSKESESLIVEFSKPPAIVIDPDSNCFYAKVE